MSDSYANRKKYWTYMSAKKRGDVIEEASRTQSRFEISKGINMEDDIEDT